MKTQIINTRGGIIGLVVFSMLFLVSNQRTKTETEHSTSLYQTLDRPMKRDRIDLAMQQEFEMTKDPNTQQIPKNKLKSALKHFDKLAGENLLKSSKQWVERGPSNMGGRTRALLFDKNDNSGKTVFAGSVSGGLWRCEDIMAAPANVKWTQLNEQLDNLSVTTIAQNEANPLQMIFGTGEGYFGESGIKGIGLYKSMDGGDSWSHISATNTEEFEYIQKVAITTEGHYYVATAKAGLQVSKDGGETWEKSLGKNKYAGSNQVSDFEIIDQNSYIAALGLQEKDGI